MLEPHERPPTYKTGGRPMIGDIVDFGTQSRTRMVVAISDDGWPCFCGCDHVGVHPELCVLKERNETKSAWLHG